MLREKHYGIWQPSEICI